MTAGFDDARLERITDHLQRRYIEPQKIAGCQTLVARHGEVAYAKALGSMDVDGSRPVRDDTVWRIYSMTKPITSVALMQLYEQGHFQLSDPVHRFIPEWRDLQVMEDDGRLVPPQQPMTVRDLLMHTSGLTYGGDPAHPVDRLYAESPLRQDGTTLEAFVKLLADLPLKFHPGTRWHYSFSTDVCGRLVEVISGRQFDEYLQAEIFDPLAMVDTGFRLRDADLDRFPTNYGRRRNKTLVPVDEPATSTYRADNRFLSGGGGLLSTMADYHRFCEMLRRGGELDGARILGPLTLDLMARNHLPGGADLADFALGTFGETGFAGVGFGLGFAVTTSLEASQALGSVGEYYWGGAASTIFWIDPVQDLAAIFMTQLMPSATFNFRGQLKSIIYSSIVD